MFMWIFDKLLIFWLQHFVWRGKKKKKTPTFDKCTGRQNSILYWNSKLGESADSVCVWINGVLCMGQLWWVNHLLNSRGIILYYSTVSNRILGDVTVFNSNIVMVMRVRKVVRGSRKHLQRNSHVINVAPLFFSLPQALFLLLLLLRANLQHAGDINRHLWAFD